MSKWKIMSPYIIYGMFLVSVFFCMPLLLYKINLVEIHLSKNIKVVLIIYGIVFYMYITLTHIRKCIYATLDLFANNFVSNKMTFINGSIDVSQRVLLPKKIHKNDSIMKIKDIFFFDLWFANNEGKKKLTATRFCSIEKNKVYKVCYGKKSKIIISIISEQGNEMMTQNI